jgi:rubrerythrin
MPNTTTKENLIEGLNEDLAADENEHARELRRMLRGM